MQQIRRVLYSSHFKRAFKNLPPQIQIIAAQREQIFSTNCFDQKPHTHKLSGPLKNYWSFSLTYEYRILFEFLEPDCVLFYDVGTHGLYK